MKDVFYDIGIIGGGFAGLAAQYRLARNGTRVILFEKEDILGGLSSSFRVDGFSVDRYYHHFFSHDKTILDFVKELNLGKNIVWNNTKMGFYRSGELCGFSTAADLLRLKFLTPFEKIRFASFLIGTVSESSEDLDDVSAAEWIIKRAGRGVYEKILEPLLVSKFGLPPSEISAAFMKGRLTARFRSRAKAKELLGYYRQGLSELAERIAEKIADNAVMERSSEVKEISMKGDLFRIETGNGQFFSRYLFSTVPMPSFLKIFKGLDRKLAENLSSIRYRAAVCLTLGLRKRLSDYYWINVADPNLPFMVVVEHTNFVPPSDYNGTHILYLSTYCDSGDSLMEIPEEKIVETFIRGLTKILPVFQREDVIWSKLSRDMYTTPIFSRNYGMLLEEIENHSVSNLFFAGNYATYPLSRNVSEVVSSGFEFAQKIVGSIQAEVTRRPKEQ